MLAFITSPRHPRNSADYGRVLALLRDSLASVTRQDHPDYSVWVVGNERPDALPAGVHFVPVDFPAPSEVAGPVTGREAVVLDKGTKLVAGLLAARQERFDHVMFLDADDLVSRRLVGLSAGEPRADGWLVDQGWRWAADRRSVRAQPEFHRHCGTAHIVRDDLYELPRELRPGAEQHAIAQALGPRLERMFGSHVYVADDLAQRGHPLAPVPFAGALYRVATGENHSGVGLGGFGRPVTGAISSEFGVPATRRDPVSLARSVLPSSGAFSQRVRRLGAVRLGRTAGL